MKPRGPLMIEHRLIEKALAAAGARAASMSSSDYDPVFIETVVDFIRTYADRTHHGKEEDILFAELAKKDIDEKNARMMAELVEEHQQARAKVKEIVELNERYKQGERSVAVSIRGIVSWLTTFYPVHIKKEDSQFFPETEKYFSPEELDSLLASFYEFDRKMIHEKYHRVYEYLSGTPSA